MKHFKFNVTSQSLDQVLISWLGFQNYHLLIALHLSDKSYLYVNEKIIFKFKKLKAYFPKSTVMQFTPQKIGSIVLRNFISFILN